MSEDKGKYLLLLLLLLGLWLIWGVKKAHAAVTGTGEDGNDPLAKVFNALSDKLGLSQTAVNTFKEQDTLINPGVDFGSFSGQVLTILNGKDPLADYLNAGMPYSGAKAISDAYNTAPDNGTQVRLYYNAANTPSTYRTNLQELAMWEAKLQSDTANLNKAGSILGKI